MLRTTTRVLALAALATLALAGSAQAKQVQQYFYSGELFEAGDSQPASIAVDSVNQKVLVVGNGDKEKGLKVSKLQLNGDPAGFSGRGEATSFYIGEKLKNNNTTVAIAVDESGTTSAGNFYVSSAAFNDFVYGYAADGTALPGFPIVAPGVCGLTTSPDGHLWVASRKLGAYGEYTATGKQTGRRLFVGGLPNPTLAAGVCRIAIDSGGNLYVGKGNHVAKYDPSLDFLGNLDAGNAEGGTRGSPLLGIDRTNDTLFELFEREDPSGSGFVTQLDSAGNPITTFGGPDPAHFSYEGLGGTALDLAVDPQTHKVYVLKGGEINVFARDPSVLTVPTAGGPGVKDITANSATLTATLDPDGIDTTVCEFKWGTFVEGAAAGIHYDNSAPCAEGDVFAAGAGQTTVTAPISGLTKGTVYHFKLSVKNANGVAGVSPHAEFTAANSPALGEEGASHITTDTARIGFEVNTEGADSSFHVEIGTDTSYGASFPVPDARVSTTRPGTQFEGTELILTPQAKTQEVSGLSPETLYHYRVVAENPSGRTEGADRTFRTFALPGSGEDKCPNAQARQQTSAGDLLDCRAYELVSAPNAGGYDVRSGLSPGVSALATSPQASDAALYSMRSGTIPGVAGHPTNRGADPYVATRGSDGWSTRYVGLPSDNPFAVGPFASPLSGSDAALDSFAFGGAEICDPCFEDGSTDVPLRLPDGGLVQGMAGSMDPPNPTESAGMVAKPLSADGSHFIFATTSQFEPDANSNGTDATIYSRDLGAGTSEVVSTDGTGAAIANGDGIAALDVSKDGTRTVIGELISNDGAGNDRYHLYLHIAGTAESVDLMPGATEGALYGGMAEDGSSVFLTTEESLALADTDESADVYRGEVSGPGPVTPQILSQGPGAGDVDTCSPPGTPDSWNSTEGQGKCNALALAGGAGVASESGDFYFFSPELLDGSNGTQDQPNLYLVEGGSTTPRFVATIDSSLVKPPPTRPKLTSEFGGSHANPQAMTVDQSNGDVYVTEGSGTLSRYDSSGAPKAFTAGPGEGTNSISGLSFVEQSPEVAIDNSGGPLDGSIYVANTGSVRVFSPTGAALGQLTGFSEACGVAVDQTNGDLYVGDYGLVYRFTPAGPAGEIDKADYAPATGISASEVCAVAADGGNVYAAGWPSGPAKQYSAAEFEAGFPFVSGTFLNGAANALSVNPATHELYVDAGNKILTFDPAGTQQLTIGEGELSGSRGVAVNADNNHVFAASEGKVSEFGYEAITIDNPAVVHATTQAGTYDSSDFQVTPDGRYAAFTSVLPIDGFDSGGHYEVFRYVQDAAAPACVSCSITTARPTSDAGLTPYGASLTDDGRVFFTTGEQLTLRDTNEKQDVYEWENGKQELISTGTNPSDSELLSVSSDGKDAFFFTRQRLVPEDENGSSVRLYTAREGGGFAFGPPRFQCAASDECHGASTAPAPPLTAGTTAGNPGQFKEEAKTKCRKGKVKRRGKCVSRKQHKRHNHKRAAKTTRGGGK